MKNPPYTIFIKHVISIRFSSFSLFILLALLSATKLCGQSKPADKPIIDSVAIATWPSLTRCAISPSGRYIAYFIDNPGLNSSHLVIVNNNGSWRKEYDNNVSGFVFAANDQIGVFQQGDSLHFRQLGENSPDRVLPILNFKQPLNDKGEGKGEWLAYQQPGSRGQLVLFNLMNHTEQKLGEVTNYEFDQKGTKLLLERKILIDGNNLISLQLLDLKTMQMTSIWMGQPGDQLSNNAFSPDGQQLAFVVTSTVNQDKLLSIWCYLVGRDKAELKIQDGDARIDNRFHLSESLEFSRNGNWLFLSLNAKPLNIPKPGPNAVQVDIWSYRDRVVQPAQSSLHNDHFRAIAATNGANFQRLETDEERLSDFSGIVGDAVVTVSEDSSWWVDAQHHYTTPRTYHVRSLIDKNKQFSFNGKALQNLFYSPYGRWMVYYDAIKGNYFSYDLNLGITHNLTKHMPTKVSNDSPREITKWAAAGIAGWIKEGNSVLLYDNYDLWSIDLSGRLLPVNVTKGYGALHHIKLRLMEDRDLSVKESSYTLGDTLLLTGFNVGNKHNGFLRQVFGAKKSPEVLYMGPYTFDRVNSQHSRHAFDNGMIPIKATQANCWLVKRQSASEAPNYFLTNDFKLYRPITQFAPQAKYNWLTSEIVNFKQLDGTRGQGVLYKPENFDPKKKYPVIFNYYEEITERLYEFPTPQFMRANIDVAWFVSRGYLVFTPDICIQPANTTGKTVGQWAYNSIVAAAQYLAKLSYVDSKHMGIQGHSFGAQETNYLVTHTHLFAAASEMAGITDQVSAYLGLLRNFESDLEYKEDQYIREAGQIRFGSTLWQHPEFYLRESAVLYAGQVTTPLLIVHNKRDFAVSWRQGVEMYMALRRLEKPVWLLQYDEGHHTMANNRDAMDYTNRATQFFDYYLKGTRPPKWMTEGVPASMKGLDNGLALDSSGKRP